MAHARSRANGAGEMHSIVKALACTGVLLSVAGCDAMDRIYSRQGVGVDLYATEGVATAQAQDDYFAKICEQAGVYCAPNSGPATWSAVVRAGMNDIDERCDGYLIWLDNIRRSQAPITKQILDTATATALIMQATGASAGSMAIVAAAFGLASSSFTNVSSRLILEVPHSTVQAIVLSRQKAYRDDLFGNPPVLIPNRPAAVYALRSYLRLCMPITIEMEINNTIATFERGGVAALSTGSTNPKSKFISAKSVGVARPTIIHDVNAPLQRFNPPAPPASESRVGPFEQRMSQKDMKRAMDILGCSGTDLGPAGSQARRALAKFLTDNGRSSSDRITNAVFFDLRDIKAEGKQGACSG